MENKWYKNKILWLCLALPILSVIGGIFTIYFAFSSKESTILEGYNKEGVSPLKIDNKDTDIVGQIKDKRLILSASPAINHDLILYFEHPTKAKKDWQIKLQASSSNTYPLPPEAFQELNNFWYLRVEPENSAWHLKASTYERGSGVENRLRKEIIFTSY